MVGERPFAFHVMCVDNCTDVLQVVGPLSDMSISNGETTGRVWLK